MKIGKVVQKNRLNSKFNLIKFIRKSGKWRKEMKDIRRKSNEYYKKSKC